MSRIDKIEQMLAAHPEDIELHYMLAMERRARGEHDAALAGFDRCIELAPNYTPAHFQKATTLLAAGQVAPAREVLEVGIRKATQSGEAHAAEEMQHLLDTLN